MNKENQNPITKRLQKIIREANLHSEKKLKGNNLSRFTGTSTKIDIHPAPQKNAHVDNNKNTDNTTKNNKDVKNNNAKNQKYRNNKNITTETDINNKKTNGPTRNNKKISSKNQRKRIWQKDSRTQQNAHIYLIDSHISIKKLKGKSIFCVGGVRSGKSDFALAWGNMFRGNKAFIATMQTSNFFEENQNNLEKKLKIKKALPPKTESNKDQEHYENSVYFQLENVKDAYRIHTRIDNEIPVSHQLNESSSVDDSDDRYQQYKELIQQADSNNIDVHNTQTEDRQNEIKIQNLKLDNRISKHQAQRGKSWITIEEPINIIRAIHKAKENKCSVAIIDCLTLWLTNLLLHEKTDKQIFNKIEELAELLKNPPLPIAIISNEVGTSIVPESALARRFQDLQGKANQILARNSNNVVASFCGLPLLIKG